MFKKLIINGLYIKVFKLQTYNYIIIYIFFKTLYYINNAFLQYAIKVL